jgi:uncharacterized Fe-S cluster-containing protein
MLMVSHSSCAPHKQVYVDFCNALVNRNFKNARDRWKQKECKIEDYKRMQLVLITNLMHNSFSL